MNRFLPASSILVLAAGAQASLPWLFGLGLASLLPSLALACWLEQRAGQ